VIQVIFKSLFLQWGWWRAVLPCAVRDARPGIPSTWGGHGGSLRIPWACRVFRRQFRGSLCARHRCLRFAAGSRASWFQRLRKVPRNPKVQLDIKRYSSSPRSRSRWISMSSRTASSRVMN